MKDSFKLFDPMKDCSSTLPDIPGNYLIALRDYSELPQIEIVPKFHYINYNGNNYKVIYTGISNIGIRRRDYNQHFAGNNAGQSTLRKSLGSLMGFSKIPRDKNKPENGKTRFNEKDEETLSRWMKENLLLFYCTRENATKSIEAWEEELINFYNPPLNIMNNKNLINEEYRNLLKKLRVQK